MFTKTIYSTLMAGLATASPFSPSRRQFQGNYPPQTTADAFTLVANISTPSEIFNPDINGWFLSGVHVGAGQNAAILQPAIGSVFFVNGTGRDVSAQATSIALPPIKVQGGAVPGGLQFTPYGNSDTVVNLGLNIGPGSTGAGVVGGLRSPWAQAFTPYPHFIVCNETEPAYGRPQHAVKLAPSVESIPDNCVAVRFLAQCASLPEDVFDGTEELNIHHIGAPCYEDVGAIDWSQYD
ncbi:hypothetical protein QBC40DRAFT_266094 [Triangularia verruculosa]|uniref:DUF7907 domain-containing protein n=1 Tax=Triangularia verruculosa TaxID=2587418 RepID=A0AAN7AU23_9PEZI|nr:hypothetical protein QBC40DRAFT_266094 [Triangularia verruculosa]